MPLRRTVPSPGISVCRPAISEPLWADEPRTIGLPATAPAPTYPEAPRRQAASAQPLKLARAVLIRRRGEAASRQPPAAPVRWFNHLNPPPLAFTMVKWAFLQPVRAAGARACQGQSARRPDGASRPAHGPAGSPAPTRPRPPISGKTMALAGRCWPPTPAEHPAGSATVQHAGVLPQVASRQPLARCIVRSHARAAPRPGPRNGRNGPFSRPFFRPPQGQRLWPLQRRCPRGTQALPRRNMPIGSLNR